MTTASHTIAFRNFRPGDVPALVALINEADAFDQLGRPTSVDQLTHEMSWPGYQGDTDCFLAWDGDRLIAYGDIFLRRAGSQPASRIPGAENRFLTWLVVHPAWRHQAIGRRLLERMYERATERLVEIESGPVYFYGQARDTETERIGLYEAFGMERVRYSISMERPIDGDLPPVQIPEGYRLRTADFQRDAKAIWLVDNSAFQDHWGYTEFPLDEFLHLLSGPHYRPELWLLAEVAATGQVVGISLNTVDRSVTECNGRPEGVVDRLAVLREHRKRGLGSALLMQSLHTLRAAGMDSARLGADADNLTGAVRVYKRAGFAVRSTYAVHRRLMREIQAPWAS